MPRRSPPGMIPAAPSKARSAPRSPRDPGARLGPPGRGGGVEGRRDALLLAPRLSPLHAGRPRFPPPRHRLWPPLSPAAGPPGGAARSVPPRCPRMLRGAALGSGRQHSAAPLAFPLAGKSSGRGEGREGGEG